MSDAYKIHLLGNSAAYVPNPCKVLFGPKPDGYQESVWNPYQSSTTKAKESSSGMNLPIKMAIYNSLFF
jgi:hypothetical protein